MMMRSTKGSLMSRWSNAKTWISLRSPYVRLPMRPCFLTVTSQGIAPAWAEALIRLIVLSRSPKGEGEHRNGTYKRADDLLGPYHGHGGPRDVDARAADVAHLQGDRHSGEEGDPMIVQDWRECPECHRYHTL